MPTDLKPSKSDAVMSVIKAAVNAVPYVGGSLASLMDDFIPTELNKRKDNLLLQLEKDFKDLEDRINTEVLKESYFISIFLSSFKSAMATEKQEKIDCYRAIILNAAIAQQPNTDEIQMMLRITDSLTPLHIKLIKLFNDPQRYLVENPDIQAKLTNVSMGGINTLTLACFPEYNQELIKVALKDLTIMGIGNGLEGGITMTRNGILSPRLTEFGKKYLTFITMPV